MNDNQSHDKNPVIYITGFGPFENHKENASQKVVEKLAAFNLETDLNVKLVTEILEVAYEPVMEKVPSKWESMKPKLVIHIGVSEYARDIVLETQAFNDKYSLIDVFNCYVKSKQCIPGYPKCLQTQLDLDKAIVDLECDGELRIKCSLSSDPGRFLCGYVYYISLSKDSRRSLFIHVPPLRFLSQDPDVAATELAHTICGLVKKLYDQVLKLEEEEEEEEVTEQQQQQ